MKKIIITGGSGLLAVNWALFFRDKIQVYIVIHSRLVSLNKVNVLNIKLDLVENIIEAINTINPCYVIHTAGITSVEECELHPSEAYYVNAQLAENVALACTKTNTKMVHISTDHLFQGEGPYIKEEEIVNPVNIYGETKAAAEKKITKLTEEVLIIRTNFYGWGPSYRRSFSDFILDNLRAEKQVTLFEDVFYTPIYIRSLIHFINELLIENARGIYNIVGNDRISKFEFGLCLAKIFNLDSSLIIPAKLSDKKSLVKRPYDMSLSNNKLKNRLNCNMNSVNDDLKCLLIDEKNLNIDSVR